MTPHHHKNVVDLLHVQHARMRELIDEMLLAAAGTERRKSLEELARLLAVHEATEAVLLHSTVRAG